MAGHFQQTKAGNTAYLNARPVGLQPVFQALFHGIVITALFHVDIIDHDQPGEVTQAQLPRHFLRSLKVGFQRCFLDRAFLGGPARVHINRHQSLGHIYHNIAARAQLHGGVEHAAEVAFHLITGEKRLHILIMLHVSGVGWHDHFHEVLGYTVASLALHKHLVNIAVIQIADRAFDQVAFFIYFGRRDAFQGQRPNLLPEPQQIFIIALYFGLGALGTGGAHNQPSAFRHLDATSDFLELLAVDRIGDFAADTTATRRVGHQDAIAPGQRKVGGEGSALIAALFLDNLHQ